jgi:hypothetical protein
MTVSFMSLLENIRLARKKLVAENALAYFGQPSVTVKLVKLSRPLFVNVRNKFERFSMVGLFSLYVDNARYLL